MMRLNYSFVSDMQQNIHEGKKRIQKRAMRKCNKTGERREKKVDSPKAPPWYNRHPSFKVKSVDVTISQPVSTYNFEKNCFCSSTLLFNLNFSIDYIMNC